MKRCLHCNTVYQDDVGFCAVDGKELVSAASAPGGDPLVGLMLDGKYCLEAKIGEGGMGMVYRGRHVHIDSVVAVKLLRESLVADQQAVERFRREALAAARIRHRNVVTVYDFGAANGVVYLVMEYLEGHDLREKIRRMGVVPVDLLVKIMVQVCAALDKAHKRGLIHRDLKPDNIWLVHDQDESEGELVKVLDFGIAKLKSHSSSLSALTERGMMVGTPFYMSPEQCRGEELDARSDIYSLGIIAYEMLTGRTPFHGGTPLEVALKQLTAAPAPIRPVNPSVPPEIEAVVLRALAKVCDERPASARQFAEELATALAAAGPIEAAGDRLVTFVGGSRAAATMAELDAIFAPDEPGAGRRSTPLVDTQSAWSTPQTPGQVSGPLQETRLYASGESASAPLPAPAPKRTLLYAGIGATALAAVLAVAAGAVYVYNRQPDVAPPVPAGPAETPTTKEILGMVYIPGGTFTMGTDDEDADAFNRPAHLETVAPFYIDAHEVSNAEYKKFVDAEGHPAPSGWKGGSFPPGAANLPVTNVSWVDAKAYAKWAEKRLPTEVEWEFAARGAESLRYPWGNEWKRGSTNSGETRRKAPAPVESNTGDRSPFGVFDMAGNVAEWVDDTYRRYDNSKASFNADCEDVCKMIRGGSFEGAPRDLLLWQRFFALPTDKDFVIGFRCAKDAP